jgi:hypothetical protein
MPPDSSTNLILIFTCYLAFMFFLSLWRRWEVYWNAIRILMAVRGRWPKLIHQLGEHKSMILNWSFFRPAIVAVILTIVQMIASRLIWPQASISWPELQKEWWRVVILLVPLIPMLAVDMYFILRVGKFDHNETVKYLDQAENWLGWKGPFVRVLTLGIVNPRKMVNAEVQKSLIEMQSTVRSSLWWVVVQTGLRLVFGLTLWTLWATQG